MVEIISIQSDDLRRFDDLLFDSNAVFGLCFRLDFECFFASSESDELLLELVLLLLLELELELDELDESESLSDDDELDELELGKKKVERN